MRKVAAAIVLAGALVIGSLLLWVITTGPHMKAQPHLRTYQFEMPLPPPGTVAVETRTAVPHVKGDEAARGAVYFHYYCVFCHGDGGAGDGPVGHSYNPVPADLRDGRIQNMTVADLMEAMINGAGHDPVLRRVIPMEHRLPLVSYLRTLRSQQ